MGAHTRRLAAVRVPASSAGVAELDSVPSTRSHAMCGWQVGRLSLGARRSGPHGEYGAMTAPLGGTRHVTPERPRPQRRVRDPGRRRPRRQRGELRAAPGQVLALLGESGSGKSVTLRAILGLHPPGRTRVSGEVLLKGHDVNQLDERARQGLRGGVVSMVFQEPMTALDPVSRSADRSRRRSSASRPRPCRGTPARARAARPRAGAVAGALPRELSARDLRRHAPARDDRDRARRASRSCCSRTSRPPRST